MRPVAELLIDHLEREPLTVQELADITGISAADLEETLRYLEPFGIVEYRQGYWTRPSQL